MMATANQLKDHAARRLAITAHDRSILVEAGAGSGKTAVMAGRIALLMAGGALPTHIAAVTFTELAASELLSRVRGYVQELLAGQIAVELRGALPDGLSDMQRTNLARAAQHIDEITCSTIHGFCQRLIKPYPVEANIDPGAGIFDRNQGDLAFQDIVESWLREQLGTAQASLLGSMVLADPEGSVALVHRIAQRLRSARRLLPPPQSQLAPLLATMRAALTRFDQFVRTAAATEEDSVKYAAAMRDLEALLAGLDPSSTVDLVALLRLQPSDELVTKDMEFRAYKKKSKWVAAAKLTKADGEQLNVDATAHYDACKDAWAALRRHAASAALAALLQETQPILQRYQDYKRRIALLDFDDLIFAARDLLRDHDVVRRALGERFRHVLVDEFQDTDPLQTEIFWRLCGDPPTPDARWQDFRIRPGALFLVADPKQAIYRFRGADVMAYVEARSAFQAQDAQSLLQISTNFRSRASILTFVNTRFEPLLTTPSQPGFTALDAFHPDAVQGIAVAALDVKVSSEKEKPSADEVRDAEADTIAELCARLIGHKKVVDRHNGQERVCRPGDIALLAPTGTDLWRYEQALEQRGIPVATQAGKGFYRRQEVQDLIALTRILANGRDTLALGALLRGPLVGLAEEELLDLVAALPRDPDAPDAIARLTLWTELDHIQHPLAANVLGKLQALKRKASSTTPHELLSQAIDQLRVRPLLLKRHGGQAERALSNVDLYLSMASGFAIRGLQAFSEAMTLAWTDMERTVEGRPDAQEEAVSLVTMHSAKGLEWPIVVPINTMTAAMASKSDVVDRNTGIFYCPLFGVAPEGHAAAFEAEKAEIERERVRLWYVAATRAREILVLPRFEIEAPKSAWISIAQLNLPELPASDLASLPAPRPISHAPSVNTQTREVFAAEAARIVQNQPHLTWRTPSRNEGSTGDVLLEDSAGIWSAAAGEEAPQLQFSAIQGSRERGLILHKLMEEVLSGQLADGIDALNARATELIVALGKAPEAEPAAGLSPGELAGCVIRTLSLTQVAALRARMLVEYPVYGLREDGDMQIAMSGIADALTLNEAGGPDIVVDWKSDVNPSRATLEHYHAQVAAYLDVTGAREGLIVMMTSGQVLTVPPGR